MRVFFTIFLAFSVSITAFAQPPNDDCGDAIDLSLSNLAACPGGLNAVTDNFSGDNINATATSPYPTFTCSSGTTNGPAAEVWFSFTAVGNQTSVTINGLIQPNVVLYQGADCISLLGIDCNNGNGSTTITDVTTVVGNTYFLLVSGNDVNDTGNFDIEISSFNLCGQCTTSGGIDLTPNPPSLNGTYSSGQTVQFCVNVNEWDDNASGSVEWLHAVTFDFGPAWDNNSINNISAPPSCDGTGSWDWYDSWVGCNTGDTFGPGFAYETNSGFDASCPEGAGNPGNNFGDGGNPCGDIPNNNVSEVIFCFEITAVDGAQCFTGDDLGITYQVWSDNNSGSWTLSGCNDGNETPISFSIICCDDDEPLVDVFDASCAGVADGHLEIQGNGGFDPSEVFNIYVFDSNNTIVYECLSCSGTLITPSDLPAGSYTVSAINLANDCPRSTPPFDLDEPDQPVADIQQNPAMPCPGSTVTLDGSVDSPTGNDTYDWTGPMGESYTGPSISVMNEGTYTLIVDVDGCLSTTATILVEFVDFTVSILGDDQVCFGSPFSLEADNGISWQWTNDNTGTVIGTDQILDYTLTTDATISLIATDNNMCTATASIDMTVNALPIINIATSGSGCANEETTLTASGAGPGGTYIWQDDQFESNPRFLNNLTPGFYDFDVIGIDANGCEGFQTIEVEILPPPNAFLTPDAMTVCAGTTINILAEADDAIASIEWLNGVGAQNENPISITITDAITIEANISNSDGCITYGVSTTISVTQPESPPIIQCGQNSATTVAFFWNNIAGADEYQISIDGNDPFIVNGPFYDATGLNPNQTVNITVLALGPNLCPVELALGSCNTLSCPPFTLDITDVGPICLTPGISDITLAYTASPPVGTFAWSGTGITNAANGIFSPSMAGVGSHDITLTYTDGSCIYTDVFTIIINNTPTSTFTVNNTTVCTNQAVMLTYTGDAAVGATYNWNLAGGTPSPVSGQGPHTVQWSTAGVKNITLTVTENGCTSTVSTQNVMVEAPITAPVLSCGTATTTSVIFNWAAVVGATSYTINVSSGHVGTLTGTSYSVTGLAPGETVTITITAETANVCGAVTSQSLSCTASTCPNFIINITALSDICLTGSNTAVNLVASTAGGAGNGTLVWSGTGVTGSQFNSITAGVGSHTITATYTEGDCNETATTTVNVYNTPTATFTISNGPICIGDNATITYTGDATAAATYTWNFNGGTIVSGSNAGPYVVNWPTAGNKTVSLTVTENNCGSSNFTQDILVEAPMVQPTINCSPNTTSIVFSWDAVAGATGYQVNIISAPAPAVGVLDEANRTYTVTGLAAGENVEIEVIAIGAGACGNSSNTFICQAQNCPNVTVVITQVNPICLLPITLDITLAAVITGGDGNGTTTWSGTGIDPTTGLFSPSTAGVGTANITVTYIQDGCTFSANTSIVINPQPTANFTIETPLCVNEPSSVIYTGSAATNANYTWDFDGGTIISGADAGPYEISWDTGGDYTPSLMVSENNCDSEQFSAIVSVSDSLQAPIIACDGDNTSIVFTWNDVAGATGYQVDILSAPAGATEVEDITNRTYSFLGLTPGDQVSIRITALTDNVCGSVSTAITCSAQSCPDRAFSTTGYGPFCADAGMQTLIPELEGNTDLGTFTWTGTSVTAGGQFNPATATIGDNILQLSYVEDGCTYMTTYTIVVNAVPVAAFTVDNEICITENSIITFSGSAGGAANYTWDFDGGTIISGSAAGPYEISWPAGGTYNPSLSIIENNCSSNLFTTAITVDEPLQTPLITCGGDNTSITFNWDEIIGATGYQIIVISSPAGATETEDLVNRTYTFSNVSPGDQATIQVIALTDNICGSTQAEQTCSAQSCSPRAFGTGNYGPFCADEDIQNLLPEIEGNTDNGTFTWSGSSVTADGQFDPSTASIGNNILQLNYSEAGCSYSTNYTIIVNAIPVATFEIETPICITASSTINSLGSSGDETGFNWDFDGGTIESGSQGGPYEISWPNNTGTHIIMLTLTEAGCVSETVEQTLEVQDTLVAVNVYCETTSASSITFAWDDVVGADSYTLVVLQGPIGTQTGNTYTVTGLTPGEEVILEVTAIGTTVCGNSVGQMLCIAQECQPLTFSIDGPVDICTGEAAAITVVYSGGQGGPLTIDYLVDGDAFQINGIASGDNISLGILTATTQFSVTQVTDESNTNCVSQPITEWTINVSPENNAGTPADIEPICSEDAGIFNLPNSLLGADATGVWSETSAVPSTGNAFNTTTGIFNATGQNAGIYSFVYTVDNGICPVSSATLEISLVPTPVADAGLDQTLTCNMGAVSLGGNSSSGSEITYLWESDNPNAMMTDSTVALIDVGIDGNYTLTVSNSAGCSDTDVVFVDSELDVPVGEVSISPISCFQFNDGAIVINNVDGGVPPYTYSLNGGAATTNPFFGNLNGAEYSLIITDANGCFTDLMIMMDEPQEVAITLSTGLEDDGNVINLGQSVTLRATYDSELNIDTIIWRPDSIGLEGGQNIQVSPQETTTYTVTITDINGCSDSDATTIIVRKNYNVFVPTAFAPGGTNDILFIHTGNNVVEVKSFLIFNRWGEAIFENYNFQSNDPGNGWDGTFRGQAMNTAVYVYFAEVEFSDGEVVIFKGDVMLMR